MILSHLLLTATGGLGAHLEGMLGPGFQPLNGSGATCKIPAHPDVAYHFNFMGSLNSYTLTSVIQFLKAFKKRQEFKCSENPNGCSLNS